MQCLPPEERPVHNHVHALVDPPLIHKVGFLFPDLASHSVKISIHSRNPTKASKEVCFPSMNYSVVKVVCHDELNGKKDKRTTSQSLHWITPHYSSHKHAPEEIKEKKHNGLIVIIIVLYCKSLLPREHNYSMWNSLYFFIHTITKKKL